MKIDKGFLFILAAMVGIGIWGYLSGDIQKLAHSLRQPKAVGTEQHAMDRLFGSDQPFDANADAVVNAAKGTQDTISWDVLAHARVKPGTDATMQVQFDDEITKLEKRSVTITGYMFPLQGIESQANFLLSAYPPSCAYCLPGGPTELIEITDSNSLPITHGSITIQGTLHLLQTGEELKEGMFYRMSQVHLISSH